MFHGANGQSFYTNKVGRLLNFSERVESTEPDANRAVRIVLAQTESQQDMRRVHHASAAGGRGRQSDERLKRADKMVRINARKREAQIRPQTAIRVTVDSGIGNTGAN